LEEHVFDLLPGYALTCLDDDELIKVAQHLATCPVCCQELLTYQKTANCLGYSAPLVSPSPNLKQKVLNRFYSSAPGPAAVLKVYQQPPTFFDRFVTVFTRQRGFALGALALVLIILLGINNLVLGREINDLRAHLPVNVNIVSLEATAEAPGSAGYLMVFQNENYGVLAVKDIPLLDANQQYQLWLIQDGKRTSGGVFSVGDNGYGALKITADQPLTEFQSFGITIEPSGGSAQPTGKKVLGSNL
jgi:hypothetical protein